MSNSAGNAMAEMAVAEESLEFKLNALKETAVGIFQNLFESNQMSAAINVLTKILELVDSVTEHIGLLGTALLTISITKFVKNFD